MFKRPSMFINSVTKVGGVGTSKSMSILQFSVFRSSYNFILNSAVSFFFRHAPLRQVLMIRKENRPKKAERYALHDVFRNHLISSNFYARAKLMFTCSKLFATLSPRRESNPQPSDRWPVRHSNHRIEINQKSNFLSAPLKFASSVARGEQLHWIFEC